MFCKKCGKQIPDDSNYCTYCGEKLNDNIVVPPQNNDGFKIRNIDERFISKKVEQREEETKPTKKKNILITTIIIISNIFLILTLFLFPIMSAFVSSFFSPDEHEILISKTLLIIYYVLTCTNILINTFLLIYTFIKQKLFMMSGKIFRIIALTLEIASIVLLTISLDKMNVKNPPVIVYVAFGITAASWFVSPLLLAANSYVKIFQRFKRK